MRPDIDIALAILSGENVRTEIIKNDYAVGKTEEKIISQVQVRLSLVRLSAVLAHSGPHRRPAYSQFDEYTGAVNRLLKEIDRLSKNDLRSSEAHIQNFVSPVFTL